MSRRTKDSDGFGSDFNDDCFVILEEIEETTTYHGKRLIIARNMETGEITSSVILETREGAQPN